MSQSKIEAFLKAALTDLGIEEKLDFKVDIPPRKELGDYASNIAILYARKLSRNPIELAEQIAKKISVLDKAKTFKKVEAAKPGFINFTLTESFLQQVLPEIQKQDHDWGKSKTGHAQKVLLEFVSANPTGPLHVGHGRWAVIGDAIGRLLEAVGCKVEREYYVNNIGTQVELLVESVRATREGREVPEGGYGGDYVKEIGKQKAESKKQILDLIIDEQKKTLENLGIKFDRWFYENELHQKEKVRWAVEKLHSLRVTFEEGGAIWFKSQELGDDKNRVLIREDGNPTYFAADIAYHLDKFSRGYDHLIDIWGTDHHGYVRRLRAAMQALDQPVEKLEIIIGQLVTLYRGKESVRMSKRTGEMITLEEVIDEIGADATRFFFSASDVNSHLDFDLELAKKKSHENPVFYVQYAHARICSILRKSEIRIPKSEQGIDLSGLTHPAERDLIFELLTWPDVVKEAARLRHPHRLTEYGKELATNFHFFYEKCRVLGNPARLVLVDASRIVLKNVLELLGICAPERM
ncbi:MAG: arginine--tRNA ligase [Candidatus Margulisiibacteriota bacterium]